MTSEMFLGVELGLGPTDRVPRLGLESIEKGRK